MTLPKQEVVEGLPAQFEDFEALVRSMSDDDAQKVSRCDGWTAGDVARHVIGQLSDVVNGRLDGLGTPEATAREVDERQGRGPKDLADELAELRPVAAGLLAIFDDDAWNGPGPAGGTTLGDGVESLWYDAWMHADDIRDAIGRPAKADAGVRASISHIAGILTTQGWGPATLALDGQSEFAVSGGGGRRVTGDPVTFIRVASGRGDPGTLGLDETVNIYR